MQLRSRTIVARRLRRDATEVEKLLWRALRESGTRWKFRRQHPIGKSIADFACPARKLVIELDGGQHDAQAAADEARSAALAEQGYRVVRFWNNDVVENMEGVVMAILEALELPPPPPCPLRP
jgi:very-short-patch-repair endonuclease